MAAVLGSYDELTDFGVLVRPELSDLQDTIVWLLYCIVLKKPIRLRY